MKFTKAFKATSIAAALGVALLSSCAFAQTDETRSVSAYAIEQFGAPPEIPIGAVSPELADAIQAVFVDTMEQNQWGEAQIEGLETIATSGDPRVVWLISDLLRFVSNNQLNALLGETASRVLGTEITGPNYWGAVTDILIAWDIPEPPNYLVAKRAMTTTPRRVPRR